MVSYCCVLCVDEDEEELSKIPDGQLLFWLCVYVDEEELSKTPDGQLLLCVCVCGRGRAV